MSDRRSTSKWIYAFGSIGPGSLFALAGFYLLYFYTDVVRLPATTITLGILIGRAWDILNDPIVGSLSDRTKSRLGRRRVWVIAGAIPLAVTTFLLLAIPAGLTGLPALSLMVVTYFLWDAALTVVHVPYYALGIESFEGYDERTSIISYGAFGALVGYFIGGVGVPFLATSAADLVGGYRLVGLVLGLLGGGTVGLAALLLKEPPSVERTAPTLRESAVGASKNPDFIRLMVSLGLSRIGLTIASASLVFFVVHHLGQEETSASLYIGVLLMTVLVSIPLWRWLASRWDKAPAYQMGLGVAAVGLGSVFLVPQGGTRATIVAVAVVGVGSAAHWVIPWSMIPDATDQQSDSEIGATFGLYGVVEKITRSFALVAVAWSLAAVGYDAAEPLDDAALLLVRLLASVVPAAFLGMSALTLTQYPIRRQTARAPAPH